MLKDWNNPESHWYSVHTGEKKEEKRGEGKRKKGEEEEKEKAEVDILIRKNKGRQTNHADVFLRPLYICANPILFWGEGFSP